MFFFSASEINGALSQIRPIRTDHETVLLTYQATRIVKLCTYYNF